MEMLNLHDYNENLAWVRWQTHRQESTITKRERESDSKIKGQRQRIGESRAVLKIRRCLPGQDENIPWGNVHLLDVVFDVHN